MTALIVSGAVLAVWLVLVLVVFPGSRRVTRPPVEIQMLRFQAALEDLGRVFGEAVAPAISRANAALLNLAVVIARSVERGR